VDRPTVLETTALGAAWLAGLQAGLCAPPPPDGGGATAAAVPTHWRLERRLLPAMAREEAERRHAGWREAVRRTLTTTPTATT
jgi:glycerol kinase